MSCTVQVQVGARLAPAEVLVASLSAALHVHALCLHTNDVTWIYVSHEHRIGIAQAQNMLCGYICASHKHRICYVDMCIAQAQNWHRLLPLFLLRFTFMPSACILTMLRGYMYHTMLRGYMCRTMLCGYMHRKMLCGYMYHTMLCGYMCRTMLRGYMHRTSTELASVGLPF
jgi:hypothetical protein